MNQNEKPNTMYSSDANWTSYITSLNDILNNMVCTDRDGNVVNADDAFKQTTDWGRTCRNGKTMYFCGNGASATMASHTGADLFKNGKLKTYAFTDIAMITAFSNDIAYGEVFASPLRQVMDEKDILVGISSSGGSPNVLNACKAAREKGGIVITCSAMKPENPLRSLGDINFYVSAPTYGFAEIAHAAILHRMIDLLVADAAK